MNQAITHVLIAGPGLTTLAVIIFLTPLAAACCGLFFRQRVLLNWVTPICSLISFLASLIAALNIENEAWIIRFWILPNLYLDSLSIYFVLLVNLIALFASFSTTRFLEFNAQHGGYHHPALFYFFFNMFHMTMLLVPMVDNLVILWISVELTTVFSTILVCYRRERSSLEAAWKFVIITTTGIIFALLGTLFLSSAIPPIHSGIQDNDLMNWSTLADARIAEGLDDKYVMLSFLFVLLGYGTKAGLAPMHTWLADGHGEAPSPVSALLSGVMLKSALYAILRFYTITMLSLGTENQLPTQLFLLAGAFSLALATPFILKRNRFKRVLAYHSLEHMGIIAFGIGIGTPVALFGALLHALNHALTKALMFLVYGSIQYEYQEQCGGDYAEREGSCLIQGVLKAMPISGTILAFGGLALVGAPPFNIFMSEFIILWSAIQQAVTGKHPLLLIAVILFVVTITLIFAGLVGHLARMLLGPAPFHPVEPDRRRFWRVAPFVVLAAMIFLFGLVVPSLPVDIPAILGQSVNIIQNGVSNAAVAGVP